MITKHQSIGYFGTHGDVDRGNLQQPVFCTDFRAAMEPRCSLVLSRSSDSGSGKKCPRVLIIEDNVDAADSLRDLFLLGERLVEVAYDGASGIVKAMRFHPDLVMCDIGLPGMDGFEVARVLREHVSMIRSRIVAWTGYVRPEDIRRCAEAGFNGYMTKPLTTDQLTLLLSYADHC